MYTSHFKSVSKCLTVFLRVVLIGSLLLMGKPTTSFAQGPTATITIDGSTQQGAVNPYIYGNFSEWGNEYMNGAWAEEISDRSFENDSLTANTLELYDHFRGSAYQPRNWTPTLLAGSNTGTISVSNSLLSISGGSNSRFGLLSNYVQNSAYLTTRVEVQLNSYTGTILTINGGNNSRYGVLSNAIANSNTSIISIEAFVTDYSGNNALMDIYGGTGAGDFSKFIEFGIENGHLQVYGDGVASWTGRKADFPAALRVVVGRYGTNGRDFKFYYNGELVHAVNSTTAVSSGTYRLFLYGWSSSTTHWDWISVEEK